MQAEMTEHLGYESGDKAEEKAETEHFEKGKRQNQLRPEHIDKVIDSYQYRKEEARYSRRASIEEIEKNDFNLNISRYVSIAIAEEEVDLAGVHGRLVEIEKDITAARKRHNDFLKELGLPPLPGVEK